MKFLDKIHKFQIIFQKNKSEVYWVLFGQLLDFIGGFVTIKILTNIMGTDGYGKLALGLTIAGLFNIFIYGPLGQVVIRFFSVFNERNQLSNYFFIFRRTYKFISFFILIIFSIVYIIIYYWIGLEWALIVLFSVLFGISSGINTFFNSFQNAIRQRKIVALHQGTYTWLRLVIAVLGLVMFSNTAYYALLGYLLSSIIIILSQIRHSFKNTIFKKHWNSNPSINNLKNNYSELWAYGSPFMLWGIFVSINTYADRWILQGLFGANEVGIYVAIYQIAKVPITLFIQILNKFMVPIIFEKAGDLKTKKQLVSSIKLLYTTIVISVLILIPTTVFTYIFSRPIVKIITSPEIAEYHDILWIVVLSLVIFHIAQTFSIVGQIVRKPNKYLLSFVFNAIVMIVLAPILGMLFGLKGIAWSSFWASIVYFLIVIYTNKKLIKEETF